MERLCRNVDPKREKIEFGAKPDEIGVWEISKRPRSHMYAFTKTNAAKSRRTTSYSAISNLTMFSKALFVKSVPLGSLSSYPSFIGPQLIRSTLNDRYTPDSPLCE
ncbi:hypothetical protein GBA52_009425 [Prunus armeniaca]|nr:hypothetical protein GBA52_009425 [Prunus armeniaca]